MTTLWIASNNLKKRAELERVLGPIGYRLRGLSEVGRIMSMRETAPDFAGNAAIKAVELAKEVKEHALGDDSGLCVDALDGKPGVLSARFGGEGLDDRGRLELLLETMKDIAPEERTARFVCSLCVAGPAGEILSRIEEECEGVITLAPRGHGGFGYDPIFVPAEHAQGLEGPTFAQLRAAEKDGLSHRGKALRKLCSWLRAHPLSL